MSCSCTMTSPKSPFRHRFFVHYNIHHPSHPSQPQHPNHLPCRPDQFLLARNAQRICMSHQSHCSTWPPLSLFGYRPTTPHSTSSAPVSQPHHPPATGFVPAQAPLPNPSSNTATEPEPDDVLAPAPKPHAPPSKSRLTSSSKPVQARIPNLDYDAVGPESTAAQDPCPSLTLRPWPSPAPRLAQSQLKCP
jgi:hypothetical protein